MVFRLFENTLSGRQHYAFYTVAFVIFLVTFDTGLIIRQKGPHITFPGKAEQLDHPWIDMQLYCKRHTPKDALFIVPPYMQGFRFFSERSTFGDWLDGMLINWTSENFAVEWLKRMRLLGWTDVRGEWSSYNNLSTEQFLKIAQEYKADYIVGETRLHLNLPVAYKNNAFVLYTTGMHQAHHQ
jgi:hypothetical protein